jgi:hypothetical protein
MKVTKIKLLERLDDETSVAEVVFDNNSTAVMFCNYSDSLKFIDKDVIVQFRKDIYNEQIVRVVTTLTELVKIATYSRNDSIKLFAEQIDNNSNVCFRNLVQGEHYPNSIVYCCSMQYKTSAKSSWAELTVMDKMRHIRKLRLFSPDKLDAQYSGHYLLTTLRINDFGLMADSVSPLTAEYSINPDIDIAEQYILKVFEQNSPVCDFLNASFLLTAMKTFLPPESEPGCLLVRTAIELDLACELPNIIDNVNIEIMKQAILFSKVYVLTPNSPYSQTVRCIITMSKYNKILNLRDTLVLLDDNAEHSADFALYKSILSIADTIVRIKKGDIL